MKKNICLFPLVIFLISGISLAKENKIIVSDLTKNCEALLEKNIVDFELCKNWTLNKNAVIDIWSYKENADILNPVRDMTPSDMRIYYESHLVVNKVTYRVNIYATSWLSLYNSKNEEPTYYACRDSRCDKYFIGNYISEGVLSKVDDDSVEALEKSLMAKLNDNRNKIKTNLGKQKTGDHWEREYKITDNYQLILSKETCKILDIVNSNSFSCYALEQGNILYVYSELADNDNHIQLLYNNNKVNLISADFIFKIDSENQVELNTW